MEMVCFTRHRQSKLIIFYAIILNIKFILQFLGIWYAVQKTSTASTCLIYNITLGEEPGEYKIEQTSQHFVLGLTPLKHEYSYTGTLTVPDQAVPGKMVVRFPLSKYKIIICFLIT